MDRLAHLKLLAIGLASGDSLGSTSEFVPRDEMPALYRRLAYTGWPFRQVGGGAFNWKPGEPTDDTAMAMCLVRSFLQCGLFDGADVAREFVAWLDTSPPDVGHATRQELHAVARGRPWYEGGLAQFQFNSRAQANGSLMRNGVTPAMAGSLEEAFRISLQQGVITHYAPLPVLCCGAQSYLIWEMLAGRDPLADDWLAAFETTWRAWIAYDADPIVGGWRARVGRNLDDAWKELFDADFNPDRFDPFQAGIDGAGGWCLLTLQIATWAAHWSHRDKPFPTPAGFADEPFRRATGPRFLSVVPLIGHDADTYAATAGPLIAACHGHVPEELTEGLLILPDLVRLAGE